MAIFKSDLRLKSYTFDFAKCRLNDVYTNTVRGAIEQNKRETNGKALGYLERANLFSCMELIEVCVYTITVTLSNFGMNLNEIATNADIILAFSTTMTNLHESFLEKSEYSIKELSMYLHVLNNKRNLLIHGVYLTDIERNKLRADILYQVTKYTKLRDLCNLVLRSFKISFDEKYKGLLGGDIDNTNINRLNAFK